MATALEQRIMLDITQAMKDKENAKLLALRSIKARFDQKNTSGKEVTEDELLKELQNMIKQRRESATLYQENGRVSLAETELYEIKVIEQYLPAQLSREDIHQAANEIIVAMGITEKNPKDMGKVIGALSKKLVGKAEGKVISEVVKELFAS